MACKPLGCKLIYIKKFYFLYNKNIKKITPEDVPKNTKNTVQAREENCLLLGEKGGIEIVRGKII